MMELAFTKQSHATWFDCNGLARGGAYFQVEIGQKSRRDEFYNEATADRTCGDGVATANSGVGDKCMRKARKKIEATQVEDLAFIGSTMSEMAALKSWDVGVDETNKQLKDLKRHEEEASLTQEERNARILDSVKRIQEFWDKHPEMKKLTGPSAAA